MELRTWGFLWNKGTPNKATLVSILREQGNVSNLILGDTENGDLENTFRTRAGQPAHPI